MAEGKHGDALLRSEDEVQNNVVGDAHGLKKALGIELYLRSFRLHHGLATARTPALSTCLESLLLALTQRCSLYQLAVDYPESLNMVLVASADLGKAALACVAEAYASTARQSGELQDRLTDLLPYLPLWVDSKPFVEPFRHLVACYQRLHSNEPIDFVIVQSALRALKDACDACGEVLAAAGPVSGTTWDCRQGQYSWVVQQSTFSFTPPDTPKQLSPVLIRPKAHSLPSVATLSRGAGNALAMPPGREAVKLAFESVPLHDSTGPAVDVFAPGLFGALTDGDATTSSGSFSHDDGSDGLVSPCSQPSLWWPVHSYAGKGEQNIYNDVCWTPLARHESYGARSEKTGLQWLERPVGFRVVMCRHMDAKGKCKKAGTCTFAHSQEDLEQFRMLFIPTERCNYGARCLYRHKDCHYSHTPGEQYRSVKAYNVAVCRACSDVST